MTDESHTEGYQFHQNPMTQESLFTKGDRLVSWSGLGEVPSDVPVVFHFKPGRIQRIGQELQES